MKKDITNLFCFVDDYAEGLKKEINSHQIADGKTVHKLTRRTGLSEGEMMMITLMFAESPCRNFKYFYQSYLPLYRSKFPAVPSYERLVVLMPRILHLLVMLLCCLFGKSTDISYIDATSLAVCHPKRISRNKVFKGLARVGRTTKGYFFGFKLHTMINEKGELINVQLTPGNVDDRKVVLQMTPYLNGFLFGDKGYISKELFIKLYRRGLKLVTSIKKNMKNHLVNWREKYFCVNEASLKPSLIYSKTSSNLNILAIVHHST